MMKTLRPFFIIMILFGISVGLYYGSLLEIYFKPNAISLEDRELMLHFFNYELSLKDVFAFGSHKYYRPFYGLSFLVDQRLYGDMVFGFRLTNILIHGANVILVFFAVGLLLKHDVRRRKIAFFSALLFAIHPTAVECVAWISGRTDPLATFWALSAMIFYFFGRSAKWFYFLLSCFCMTAAVLTKETAIVIPVIFAIWEFSYRGNFSFPRNRYTTYFFLTLTSIVLLYLFLRSSGLASSDMGTGLIAKGIKEHGILFSGIRFLASIGFYIKKFVFPFPLNAAITDINIPICALIGFLFLSLLAGTFFWQPFRQFHFYLVWAFFCIVPAALLSFTSIAWTPWAERYLYFSLIPLSIFTINSFFSLMEHQPVRTRYTLILNTIVLVIFAVSTLFRSFIWNDDLRFWEDTYRKSPRFIYAAVGYAGALAGKGHKVEAEKVLTDARSLPGAKHTLLFNLGNICRNRGDLASAKKYYHAALLEAETDPALVLKGPSLRSSILQRLAEIELKKASESDDQSAVKNHYKEAIRYFLKASQQDSSNLFLLYRIAKLYLKIGSKNEAAGYLRKFIATSGNDIYAQTAQKLLREIENKNNS